MRVLEAPAVKGPKGPLVSKLPVSDTKLRSQIKQSDKHLIKLLQNNACRK